MRRSSFHEALEYLIPYSIIGIGILLSFIFVQISIKPLYKIVGDNAWGSITFTSADIYFLGAKWSSLRLDVGIFFNRIGIFSIIASTILGLAGFLAGIRWRILIIVAGYIMGLSLLLLGVSSVIFLNGIEDIESRLASRTSAGLLDLGTIGVEPAGPVWIVDILARTYIPQGLFLLLFLLSFYYHYEVVGGGET